MLLDLLLLASLIHTIAWAQRYNEKHMQEGLLTLLVAFVPVYVST